MSAADIPRYREIIKTAMSHREHVMDKLDVHNRTDLVKLALRLGGIKL